MTDHWTATINEWDVSLGLPPKWIVDGKDLHIANLDKDTAHLIAAAPALLKALEKTITIVNGYAAGSADILDQARAAIAQAKGE